MTRRGTDFTAVERLSGGESQHSGRKGASRRAAALSQQAAPGADVGGPASKQSLMRGNGTLAGQDVNLHWALHRVDAGML